MIDKDGYIVRAQYTENANAAVYDGYRLLLDIVPEFDATKQILKRIEPVSLDALQVQYEIKDIEMQLEGLRDYSIEDNKQYEDGAI